MPRAPPGARAAWPTMLQLCSTALTNNAGADSANRCCANLCSGTVRAGRGHCLRPEGSAGAPHQNAECARKCKAPRPSLLCRKRVDFRRWRGRSQCSDQPGPAVCRRLSILSLGAAQGATRCHRRKSAHARRILILILCSMCGFVSNFAPAVLPTSTLSL